MSKSDEKGDDMKNRLVVRLASATLLAAFALLLGLNVLVYLAPGVSADVIEPEPVLGWVKIGHDHDGNPVHHCQKVQFTGKPCDDFSLV